MQNNKYVKKPIPIEAYDFSKTKIDIRGKQLTDGEEGGKCYINTLEGKHYVRPDDFIIIGVRGERYPVKRDIFFETYERAYTKDDNKKFETLGGF